MFRLVQGCSMACSVQGRGEGSEQGGVGDVQTGSKTMRIYRVFRSSTSSLPSRTKPNPKRNETKRTGPISSPSLTPRALPIPHNGTMYFRSIYSPALTTAVRCGARSAASASHCCYMPQPLHKPRIDVFLNPCPPLYPASIPHPPLASKRFPGPFFSMQCSCNSC